MKAAVPFVLLLLAVAPAALCQVVCTFDELPNVGNGNLGTVPSNYCGINWLGSGASSSVLYFSGSFTFNGGTIYPHSQPNALYSSNGIGFSFPSPAVFNGFWAIPSSVLPTGHPGEKQAVQVTLSGPNGSYTGPVTDVPQGGAFVSSGYSQPVSSVNICVGIDLNGQITCTADGDTIEAIDDITYNATSCVPSIAPLTQQNFPTTGGTGTITVSDNPGCTWSASSDVPWITITAGASGTGNGTVSYTVAANTDSGFRDGTISISDAELPIQEAGVAQFQAQGTMAGGGVGTANILADQLVTFSGSGWQPDGGSITVTSTAGFNATFSPPSFSGNINPFRDLIFPKQGNPPCTVQLTATQGSITKTVTLTGIYLAKVVVPDSNETVYSAGEQICQTTTVASAQQFINSGRSVVKSGAFAIESAPTALGGSVFNVLDPNAGVNIIYGILVNPGSTVTFPDPQGNTVALTGDGTTPIVSTFFVPPPGPGNEPQRLFNPIGEGGVWVSTGDYNFLPEPLVLLPPSNLAYTNGSLPSAEVYLTGSLTAGGMYGFLSLFATGNITLAGNVDVDNPGAGGAVGPAVSLAAGGNISIAGSVPPSLTPIPGSLKQVAVGADGAVWGINAQQQIYSYNPDPGWANIPGALTQIAVGSSAAIWGINAQQQIYRWDSVNSVWINVPGSLKQIAVGSDGDVWGLNYQSSIYHYNAQTGFFNEVPGTLSQITVGSGGAVYGLNPEGGIYWYNPGTSSFQWISGSIGFTQVAVGADGDLWAVQNSVAYHYDVLHNTMDATPGSIVQLAAGSGSSVFGLDPNGQIFQWNAASGTWNQIQGTLSSISAGANGAGWGVNASQQIFSLSQATRGYQTLTWIPGSLNQVSIAADGSAWGLNGNTIEYFNSGTQSFQPISGAPNLAQLSAGPGGNVWGVDPSGNIYQYVPASGTWNVIPGELNFIDVGANGSVWGINAAGETYTFNASNQSWTNIPGTLAQLSVGGDGTVWGINAQQQIFRYNPNTQSWVNVPGALMQISVGNANSIWGINAGQQVYQYNTSTQSWVNIPGASLVTISVAPDGSVWGVNAAGNLYEWNASTQSFSFMGDGISSVVAGNAAAVWALNSWGGIFFWF